MSLAKKENDMPNKEIIPDRLQERIDRANTLKALARDLERQQNDYLLSMIDRLQTEERLALAHDLYWRPELRVTTRTIATMLGDEYHPQGIHNVVGPHNIELECKACGKRFLQKVTTRNDLSSAHSRWSRKCPDCSSYRADPATIEAYRTQAALEARRLEELQSMSYAEYLQTPEWDATRGRALKRAGYRCQVCNRNTKLHVHHRTYERRGRESNNDLIALCEDCHKLYHFGEEE